MMYVYYIMTHLCVGLVSSLISKGTDLCACTNWVTCTKGVIQIW